MADGRAFAAAANATRWRRTVNSCCFNFVVNFVVNFVEGCSPISTKFTTKFTTKFATKLGLSRMSALSPTVNTP